MQQLALSPSQPLPLIPHGHVSLWDMINCNVRNILVAYDHLVGLEHILREVDTHGTDDRFEDVMMSVRATPRTVLNLMPTMRDDHLMDRIRRLEFTTDTGARTAEYADHVRSVREALEDALRRQSFYHYPADRASFVRSFDADWGASIQAFPTITDDARSAVDCYALGHPVASIYHCMMILERGLPALARRVGTKFRKSAPTWRDMISDIRTKIDDRRTALSHPPKGRRPLTGREAAREKTLLDSAGEAAVEFRFFEHAWRNHIAHARTTNYDECDALRVLAHVRGFMATIATKMQIRERSR